MMHSNSQVALEIHLPSTKTSLLNDGDYNLHSSTSVAISTQKPGPKRTRQWAAWTRQEQENFFNALRQVGKNFEKITCCVQSKNKNQVRHYYYRLVRRMNKLLSPGFCLDAKNSKDTNAAMLRWWSLLEKYSCSPSKLHLKPRRFKIFIEALESQLRKDRNKCRRKRTCQESFLETSTTSSFLSRFSGHEFCGVKAVIAADAENVPKSGISRGPSMKRSTNSNVNFSKGIFSGMKTTGQKQRIGLVESAAYKRWEKAAMAGVSLVADAAEQLERVTNRENCSFAKAGICSHGVEDAVMQTREKLKLQLFPIDEDTRRRLEKDAHNPFLELTLSTRKRISSVIEHLNRKWGIRDINTGELLLLPYSIQKDEFDKCQRWTIRDAVSTAADVHACLGNPSIFRLRYGWSFGAEPSISSFSLLIPASDDCLRTKEVLSSIVASDTSETTPPSYCASKLLGGSYDGTLPLTSVASVTEAKSQNDTHKPNDGLPESSGKSASWTVENNVESSRNQQDEVIDRAVHSGSDLLAGEWADSLTNISVGDLLLEASEVSSRQNALCIQHTSISCDSFDAAVAAHSFHTHFSGLPNQPPAASIWNGEETCDEFSFKAAAALKTMSLNPRTNTPLEVSKNDAVDMCTSSWVDRHVGDMVESGCDEPESDNHPALSCMLEPAKDVSLADLYWSDSLGSLGQMELDLSFPRYQAHDVCFSESISQSSFSRMIAGSLDVFQSASLLGTDKKDIADALGKVSAMENGKMDI